jgi:hypothetical protein
MAVRRSRANSIALQNRSTDARAYRGTLDTFRTNLLARCDGTYEGAVHTYLGCEIERDIPAGRTLLSQRHFAEDVLRTFEMWDCISALTPMKPGTRLTKEQSNPSPDPAFHRRYRGIVGSLGYLVNMTRPDLAWSYSELSKYVQYRGQGKERLSGVPPLPYSKTRAVPYPTLTFSSLPAANVCVCL